LPRKSLTPNTPEDDTPRITIRISDEIKTILADIDKNDKYARSAFIRDAIVHYASSSTFRIKTSSFSVFKDDAKPQITEKEQPETPFRVLHKPAWQR